MMDGNWMAGRKALLAVLAHPDDETFGIGGTLALYARRGVDVYLICATKGEAGMVQPKYLEGYASVAELREAELRSAASKLGLKEVIFLDYRDSGMSGSADNYHPQALMNAPLPDLVRKITILIRKIRPQVVITFDPVGGYYHPDHICIHQAARQAFYNAADPAIDCQGLPAFQSQKLYFYTISKTIMRWMVRLMPLVGKDPSGYGQNGDIDLRVISKAVFPVNARIDYSEAAGARMEASMCYVSQGGQHANRDAAGLLRGWAASTEIFMRDYPLPQKDLVEKDLFAGVVIE
jgi:N-acetyl-1-D-myo-inositol-2-amino-2-deoxy-alpha-D-glucopyranoside deacetylase